jgi:tRNA-specific 2-thiouridylase
MGLGGDLIATGHYAQVREKDGLFQLMKADDGSKDQSYFLYRLNQAQLSKTLFPLGHLLKREVREIARKAGLPTSEKKDSTGICFIGERPFREFLNRYLPRQPGEMQTPDGKVVGEHEGLMYYTYGQRQGLGIGGSRDSSGEPWFVAGKDMQRNVLIVVQGHDHPMLLNDGLVASQLHWIAGHEPQTHWVYAAKTRYRQPDAPCEIDRLEGDEVEIRFGQPQWAITPGQSAVVYESNVCLGGGIIARAI